VVAHGLLAGRSVAEVEFLFRSLYINTDPQAEVVVDVPDPHGTGLMSVIPPPIDHPRPVRIQEIASRCGWDHIVTQRLSAGRSGMFFRKKILTDRELIPVVTDLLSSVQRIHTIDERLASVERRLQGEGIQPRKPAASSAEPDTGSSDAMRKRAEAAERDLERLRSRRSVRFALAMAQPTRGLFRTVRSWKKKR
jgi:hypothetical protein